jgi:ATP-dependent exoDNAse (exonuclease V) alpha subunit
MAHFRTSVEAMGYQVGDRSKHGNFEAAGIARNMIMAFSTRRQQILDKVAGMASRTPEAFHAATLMTRTDKAPIEDRPALYAGWKETATEIGLDLGAVRAEADARVASQHGIGARMGDVVAPIVTKAKDLANSFASALGLRSNDPYLPRTFPNKTPSEVAAAHAVASAIRHLEQREAGFSITEIYKAALDFGLPTRIDEVERAVTRQIANGNLHRGQDERAGMVTTAQALDTERRILAGVDAGRNAVHPVLSSELAADSLQTLARDRSGYNLNAGQEAAGRLMFASKDRIIAIQGVAGAGKSSVLAPAARLFEAQGHKVMGLAVQNTLVRMLERDTGIASMTVARFVKTYGAESKAPAPASLKGAVLIVDEASMLANADQLQLIEIANRHDVARLVFVGDSRQLGAVDAGKPFALVQDAGIETARMDANLRARDSTVRGVAEAAQAGDVAKAMMLLGAKVIEADGTVVEQATQKWLSLPKAQRDQTMIFASGRRLRDAVNTSVQESLKVRGELGERGHPIQVLDRVNLTNEELRYSHHYQPRRVVELGRSIREQRLDAGRYTITEVDQNGRVHMRDEQGKAHRLAPDRVRQDSHGQNNNRLALYDLKKRTIHAGDRIRWTANDHERGLLNADRATVTAIGNDRIGIETSSGIKLALAANDPMLARIDLAYAYNAHMAQGMTADRAIVVIESRDTRLLTRQNFLVSVTRARDDLTIYVDKADKALARLEPQTGEKTSALKTIGEVVKDPPELEIQRSRSFDFGIG